MSLKNKTFQIILRIICGLFFVLAIFLSVTAVVYSLSDGTPNIFGSNVYLVKTDAFGFLTNGTALISKQVPPSEIQRTNIVIFNLENGKPALGQVLDSELADGVYSFRVLTENNAEITLTQSQVVAKGMSYSDILGALIRFAVSPFGMMIVAIVPCIIIIILEIVKFAGKIMPQPEIETIKKQYEVPTYVPDADRQPQRERRGTAEAAKAYRTASLDRSIGIYDTGISETSRQKRQPADAMNDYADIAARQQQSPLFTNPTRKQTKPVSKSTMPLSAKKLNEAIEATKAEHELDDMRKMREQVVRDIQKTRGAAIAAEKAFETGERQISDEARKTSRLARTTVIGELSRERTSEFTEAAARAITAQEQRRKQATAALSGEEQAPQKKIQRPALRLNQDDPSRQYNQPRRNSNTTTSIPRLDSLLREDSDSDTRYNIDEILAGLDRRRE